MIVEFFSPIVYFSFKVCELNAVAHLYAKFAPIQSGSWSELNSELIPSMPAVEITISNLKCVLLVVCEYACDVERY